MAFYFDYTIVCGTSRSQHVLETVQSHWCETTAALVNLLKSQLCHPLMY